MSKKIKSIGSCQDCLYWIGVDDRERGECRRRSPIAIAEVVNGVWPETNSADFCGEFADQDKN